jgi:hypothetical protein
MYVDKNPLKLKILENNRSKHLKTLKEIQESKSRMLDCSTPETFKAKKQKKYFSRFKAQEIYRENQNLLERLINLNFKTKKSRDFSESPCFVPRSLNCYERKLLQDRIEFENKGISSRIISITPSVNSKNLKKEFDSHVKMLEVLSKFDYSFKEPKRKKLESLALGLKNESFSKVPSGVFRNPYVKVESEMSKKEWKIAEFNHSPSEHYLMAVPMAVSPNSPFN